MDDASAQTALWRLVDRDGSFHILPESVTLLGREGCHIVANSRSVDLKHAIIAYDHCTSTFKIKDLSSLNGTYVNDTRIAEQTYVGLNHGDHLRLGYDVTVYRVEMATCSPQTFAQYISANELPTDAESDRSTDLADAGWITLRASASKPPVVAECQGCIKEQLLHHVCDDNAEDARQAGDWCSRSGSRSPVGRTRSPVLASPAALRPTWDRKGSPEHAALSSPPWPLHDGNQHTRVAEPTSMMRKSLSMPEAHGPVAPVAARGTPLYGQPAWWGDDMVQPEAAGGDPQHGAQGHLVEGSGGSGLRGAEQAHGAKPTTGRPVTLPVQQQTTHPQSNGAIAAGSEPSDSSVSPGKVREPAMPGTAFTVNFNNSNDAHHDEEAVSPKVGDSLSCFMPEQLRQSLRKRHKKPSKEQAQLPGSAAAADDGATTTLKSASPALAATRAKKVGKTAVTSDDNSAATDLTHSTRAATDQLAPASGSAKNERVRTVPSSVAFLMGKMYDADGSEGVSYAAAAAVNVNDDAIDAPAFATAATLQLTSPPQLQLLSPGTSPGRRVISEHTDDHSDDGAVSEAGTYTVEAGEAQNDVASDVYSDNELSSLCSDEEGAALPKGTADDRGQRQSPVFDSRNSIEYRTHAVTVGIPSPNSNGNGSAEPHDHVYSSLNVEVGHWSALLDADAGADQTGSSSNSGHPETVRLSRPARREVREPAVRTSNALDREPADRGAPSQLSDELSVDSESTATSSRQKPAEAAEEAAAAMYAGTIATHGVISPVEPDIELFLGSGRGDDVPVRRVRREAASELSKERLLQELGIGDAPVQAVERPKLVQEILSSRKHHRDDDPVIVSKSKSFFEKIRSKGDQQPSSGEQQQQQQSPAAAVAKPSFSSGDDRLAEGKHPALHRASSDSASLRNTDAASAAWGGASTNGHHHHSSAAGSATLGLSLASISDSSSDAAAGGAANRGDSARHAADHQKGQRYVDKLAALSRGELLQPADSPRDGEVTARTDATARTELLLQPTDEFVRSMSAKRSRGGRRAAETSNNAAPPTAAAYFGADASSKVPGGGGSGGAAAVVADPRRVDGDRRGRIDRPPLQQQQPDHERFDTRPPRQPTGTAQAWRQGGAGSSADVVGSGSAPPRGMTSEALALSLAASRSGRSSTDSLASRGSSDGGFLGAGARGKDRQQHAAQQQHVRHASDSSSTSVRVASAAATAASAAVSQPAASTAAARPNRTFELRRARTLAAPDSDRSSARSSSGTGSSVVGGSGTQPRSRSGSLERASEVSLGARIVQRSRQAASGSNAGGASGSSNTFATEVRGAKVSLAAKSATTASGGSSSFTRSDGGRYSMRVSSGGAAASSKARQQVPAKKSSAADGGSSAKGHGRQPAAAVLAAAAASSQAKAELEREKAAWERRRSYDPRKSAAMGGGAGSSGASSVSSTPRQQSLGSRASSGTASPVTPITLRQQQQQQTLDRVGGGGSAYSPLVTPSSSRRCSAGTAADDYGDDDDSHAVTADGDCDDDDGSGYDAEPLDRSEPLVEPVLAATVAARLRGSGGGGSASVDVAAAAQHELQIAKMSSELAKDLELLSRGAEEEEDEDEDDSWDATAASSVAADVGSAAVEPRVPGPRDSGSGRSSSCDEMVVGGDRSAATAQLPRPRLVHDVAGGDTDDSTLPDTYRAGYDDAGEAVGRPDSSSGKSAFTSYSAFTEPGLTPPGKANSPALSPVKKKVVEMQWEENGGSPQIPDQNYDTVMVSSIKHISNRLSKSTSRILTRLREKVDLPSAHSSEEEAEAADRAAETLLGDHGSMGTELPGSQELAAALRTLRRAERNVRAVERALFTNDSYPEITPTVTTHERDHYLAEIRRIRDEITGFKPIASVPTSSAEEIRKVAVGLSSATTATATTKVLASKPASFTTVKSLTSLRKTYY